MNAIELLQWVRRRLSRKAKQAEQAYVSEFTVKITTNCSNHGIQLSDGIFHCKINAMGLHEQGASQCWSLKARICPLFELKRGVEDLKRDFRAMRPNELAIRWPSIGELIRFEHLLSQTDEVKVVSHEEAQPGMRLRDDDQLSPAEDAEKFCSDERDVRGEHEFGYGDSSETPSPGINEGGESDAGSTIIDSSNEARLPLAPLGRSRDGTGTDRT